MKRVRLTIVAGAVASALYGCDPSEQGAPPPATNDANADAGDGKRAVPENNAPWTDAHDRSSATPAVAHANPGDDHQSGGGPEPDEAPASIPAPTASHDATATESPAQGVIDLLDQAGMEAEARTFALTDASKRLLATRERAVHAVASVMVAVENLGVLLVFVFDDAAAHASFTEENEPLVRYEHFAILPAGISDHGWDRVADAFVSHGGERRGASAAESPDPASKSSKVAALRDMLREEIARYQQYQGAYPDFERRQWADLITHDHINASPRNPNSPDAVATKVIVMSAPHQTASTVNPREAGWVWNKADKILYATGVSDTP